MAYSRSTSASASCREQGHSVIASATECETAARMLKLKVTTVTAVHTSNARPAGCFLYTGAKPSKLEFNTDATPSRWAGGWSDIFTICRQTSSGSGEPALWLQHPSPSLRPLHRSVPPSLRPPHPPPLHPHTHARTHARKHSPSLTQLNLISKNLNI